MFVDSIVPLRYMLERNNVLITIKSGDTNYNVVEYCKIVNSVEVESTFYQIRIDLGSQSVTGF